MKLSLSTGTVYPRFEARYDLGGLHFAEVSYPFSCAPIHAHKEATLVLGLHGTLRHDCRKRSTIIAPSTLAFLPVGEPHANQYQEGVKVFQIVIEEHWLAHLRQVSALVSEPVEFSNSPPVWLAMRLFREFQHQDDLTPLALEGLMMELLTEMSRRTVNFAEKNVPLWLRQARDFLHAHFTESISLDAMAAAVGVHPDHLTRAFRQHYQTTIGEYARRLRVEYACHLLSTSELPLSQLALDIGFADQGHFSRIFKSGTGMTPAEFRKFSGGAGLR
jgi:AraC family transcriptional regulator